MNERYYEQRVIKRILYNKPSLVVTYFKELLILDETAIFVCMLLHKNESRKFLYIHALYLKLLQTELCV